MSELYCICRSQNSKGFMICCEACGIWFHGKCIKLKKKNADDIDLWYCDSCMSKDPKISITYKPGIVPPSLQHKNEIKLEPNLPGQSGFAAQHKSTANNQDKKFTEKNLQSTSAIPRKTKPVHQKPLKPSPNKPRRPYHKGKSRGHQRIQCANPECVYESRPDSKYCSHECGYAFNKLRYETHFIPRWKVLEQNHSQARFRKMQDYKQLEDEKVFLTDLMKEYKLKQQELDRNIRTIKEQATKLYKESEANLRDNEDEDADLDGEDAEEVTSGDLSKTFCITCGLTISSDKAFKHWASCHKKHESSFAFTANLAVGHAFEDDPDPQLFCHHQDKKTKRYCMHLKSACPQHSNWQSTKDEVCGCPLNLTQEVQPDGAYCLRLKKDCNQHYHWDKFRLAQINMQRAQTFHRIQTLVDLIYIARNMIDDTYGGVIGVMLHRTLDHKVEADETDPSPFEERDIDVEITTDQ